MTKAGNDDTQPVPWLGRAPAPRPRLPDTAELPVVPAPVGPPPVLPAPPSRRLWTFAWIVAVMVLCFAAGATIALLANAGLRNQLGLGPALHESSSSSPSPTEPPPPGIGDPVRDTTVEFRVTEVSCGHSTVGEGVFTRRARGQYCVASYELRNVGNTLAILTVNDQFAVTTAGSRHQANADATAAANDLLFVLPLPLAPGDSSAGKIVFDIPADATLATLELHDSGRSDGVVITVNLA
jgi:Telomeric repeat-binding factor 2.